MNSIKKVILIMSIVCGCLTCTMTSISANSAQMYWSGTDSTGAIVLEEDSPIIVEKELLTFDIQEFPQMYYHSIDEFQAYSAKVTAEYTFYNPSDYTVTATLVFPFGGTSDYADIYDNETDQYVNNADIDKYDITIDGNVVDKQVRHTYMYYGEQFELDKDLARLHDGYMDDVFYYPEQVVTKFTYKASGVDLETYDAATAAIVLNETYENRKLYLENQTGYTTRPDYVLMSTWMEKDMYYTVYVIGEAMNESLQWKIYENGGCKEEIEGRMELVQVHWMYLKDFALSEYKEEYGILDYDWYNMIITKFKNNEANNGVIHSLETLDVTNNLMRWYQYEITLQPKQRIVNTVTAPMYPAINSRYEPAIYNYTYLLSPAKTWSEFGNLDIVIHTPYYMTVSGLEGFTYNNPGYELHFTGLPEGELTFTLCESANPKAPVYRNLNLERFVICGSVVAIAWWLLSRKKK